MTGEELVTYLQPAIRRLFNVEYATVRTALQLEELLGITEYSDFYTVHRLNYERPMPEELKKLLVMLAGPHGKTILKMYRIRKGLE